MIDPVTEEWRDRFELIWDKGDYRNGSQGQRLVPYFMEFIQPHDRINAYGCGLGRAEKELVEKGHTGRIHLFDIVDVIERGDWFNDNQVDFRMAPLWDLPHNVPISDWGFCIDVLMTLPRRKLNDSLKEIKRTCLNLFVAVFYQSDIRCEIELTTIQESADWWAGQLMKHWREVKQVQPPYGTPGEHYRYVFVCRGNA